MRYVLGGVVIVLVLLFLSGLSSHISGTDESSQLQANIPLKHTVTDTVYINQTIIRVSIADDQQKRRQGLSGITTLSTGEGKLFVFERESYYGIWMKDMLLSIDILWFDSNFQLVHVEENITPSTYPTTYTPEAPALYVLEVNAGFVYESAIKIGDFMSFSETEE